MARPRGPPSLKGRNNMRKHTWSSIIFATAVALFAFGHAFGQETTGAIVGTVKDTAGAAVPGATVTVTDPTKDNLVVRSLTSNDNGEFSVPNLQPGTYDVAVEGANFKKFVSTGVKVDVSQRRPVDVVLSAGNISEVVTVQADQVSVEANTPAVSTTINGDQIRELSINNRNFVQLVTLAPGVSSNLSDQVYVGSFNPDGQANTVGIAVNGARQSQNTWTVDGADITDRGSNITIQAYPSVDSIREFKVQRSLYPAESGRSGGGQINVVTRSGGDKFHGSLFEFVRNEKFNANTFILNRTASTPRDSNGKAIRPPFRYNNYGFTVGGPVYFLKFGDHDPDDSLFGRWRKTYFFFSEEQRKDRRYSNLSGLVPTAGMRTGRFANPICIRGTIVGTTRTCNLFLPAGAALSTLAPINPVAQQYLDFIYAGAPVPNTGTFGINASAVSKFDFQQEIVKIDTNFTDNWSAYYRYQRDKIPATTPNSVFNTPCNIPGVCPGVTDSPGRTHTIQTTYILSPNLILEGRYTYAYGAILVTSAGSIAKANSPIAVPLPYDVDDDRVPQLTLPGLSTLTAFGPYNNFSDKHDYSGSLTWIKGSHTMKFGAFFSKYRKNEDNGLGGTGQGAFSTFNNATGATNGLICADASGAGIACAGIQSTEQTFANFLLGDNVTFTQTKFRLTADFRQRNFEGFAQDEFKFRPNLTLYGGVRYSFFGAPWAANGLLSNFVPELWQASQAPRVTGAGDRVSGSGNYCNGIVVNAQNYQTGPASYQCTPIASPYGKYVFKAPRKNFAPRVGLAWDPWSNGNTVIRTGYGIYHEQTLLGNIETHLGANPPYQETLTITRTRLDQPVPPGTNLQVAASNTPPNLIRGVDLDYKTPYMQHWSLDVQHVFDKNTFVSVGYYGSKGTNLIGIIDINNLPPGYARTQRCAVGTSTTPTVDCQGVDAAGLPIPFTTTTATNILDQIRPFRGYRAIAMVQPRYNSTYHSLQVSATRRLGASSQVQLAYTWAKNLTDNLSDRSNAAQNTYDVKSEYGRAFLDRRHVTTVNYVYELPFFDHERGVVGQLLGGWQISGIGTYQTGLPFTPGLIGNTFDPSGIGYIGSGPAGGRPNAIRDPNENAPNDFLQFFDIDAFQRTFTTGSLTPGNAGKSVIEGPRTFRIDFTVTKIFKFNEDMRLQLRAEAFNVLNTTNFSSFNVQANSTAFGNVTAVRDPRTLQFGIKFYF